MSEYVRSSKGVGCLGCQPSGFGLFKQPTIGSMGTDSWLDWPSGEEPQPVTVVRTLAPGFTDLVRSLKRVGTTTPSNQAQWPLFDQGVPSTTTQTSGSTAEQQAAAEAAALLRSQANVNLEEGGAPNWVGPVIMGVIGLGIIGGTIWGLKKLDVI
jgi:hypothetical protein